MLTSYQIELIHREIDGENTSEASAQVRQLVNTQPEARALMNSLESLDALFREVPDRAPAPRVRLEILNAMSRNSRPSPKTRAQRTTISSWATQQWNGVSNFMEELMSTKKVLIAATTAVAAIAIIGQVIVGYKPSVFDAGTVGAKNGMSGVQKADRYKGRELTKADVTLSNPEVSSLFQDDKVLKLVKSDAFHQLMNTEAFHELQSSEAFQHVASTEAFQQVMANEAALNVLSSEAFHEVMTNDALREVLTNDAAYTAGQKVSQNEAAHDVAQQIAQNDALHTIMANEAFRELLANESARELLSSEAFHQLFANEAFRELLNNDAFHAVLANEAFRELESSEMFQAISREQSLSELFLNEAGRQQ